MAKIMLVEDDNNLREIYGARLLAEGHQIVAAKDGEEALALAVKEKPDLIISDIMMPRISGFEMLDILRNAPETRNTKVIMMTALSQAEDKARADKLGADRYLVKSQVTLEDVAKVVRDVLTGEQAAPAAAAPPAFDPSATTPPVSIPMPADTTSTPPAVATPPVAPAPPLPTPAQIPVTDASTAAVPLPPVVPTPAAPSVALPTPPAPTAPVTSDAGPNMAQDLAAEEKAIQDQIDSFASSQVDSNPPAIANGVVQQAPPIPPSEPVAPPAPVEQPAATAEPVKTPENAPLDDQHNVASKRIIQPINEDLGKPDLDALLAAEEAKEAAEHPEAKPATPPAEPKSDVDHNSIAL
jgi:CheY-like chemotaxis protein